MATTLCYVVTCETCGARFIGAEKQRKSAVLAESWRQGWTGYRVPCNAVLIRRNACPACSAAPIPPWDA